MEKRGRVRSKRTLFQLLFLLHILPPKFKLSGLKQPFLVSHHFMGQASLPGVWAVLGRAIPQCGEADPEATPWCSVGRQLHCQVPTLARMAGGGAHLGPWPLGLPDSGELDSPHSSSGLQGHLFCRLAFSDPASEPHSIAPPHSHGQNSHQHAHLQGTGTWIPPAT